MIFVDAFLDPVLRAPLIGSMLMSLAASLVGVLVFVRKRSLLGEALSHSTYPGVTASIVLAGFSASTSFLPFYILCGALVSALLGYFLIDRLEKTFSVSPDAALCFILALFFGVGVTLASVAQNTYTALYQQIQTYLYGQAATMTDLHILIYGLLTLFIGGSIFLFYKEILALSFDRAFAKTAGLATGGVRLLFIFLVVLAVVIGIRSVGVILMSAMLIAPPAAARQFTNRLSRMFLLSALFGTLSGCIGTFLSFYFSGMPTGPMIVLVAGSITLYALFFAPERGLLIRYWRAARFRTLQMQENLLKWIWRVNQKGEERLCFAKVASQHGIPPWRLSLLLHRLCWRGWLQKEGTFYRLTPQGVKRGGQIVRLHRLWEVYLVNALGLGVERVHKSAEEMEHILTPELERALTNLLDDPKVDPHRQPIPAHEEVMHHA